MPAQTDFPLIFEKLKAILKPYSAKFTVREDGTDGYSLEGPYSQKWKKELFFGAAQIKKNYVSFYLMPVYMYPDLLNDISPELRKHMQGKSCFNFKKVEPELFTQLAELAKKGCDRFREEA